MTRQDRIPDRSITSQDAPLVVACVRFELARGTEYFDIAGRPLATEREILEAFVRDAAFQRKPARLAQLQ